MASIEIGAFAIIRNLAQQPIAKHRKAHAPFFALKVMRVLAGRLRSQSRVA
jgi:hypothetical protein